MVQVEPKQLTTFCVVGSKKWVNRTDPYNRVDINYKGMVTFASSALAQSILVEDSWDRSFWHARILIEFILVLSAGLGECVKKTMGEPGTFFERRGKMFGKVAGCGVGHSSIP